MFSNFLLQGFFENANVHLIITVTLKIYTLYQRKSSSIYNIYHMYSSLKNLKFMLRLDSLHNDYNQFA